MGLRYSSTKFLSNLSFGRTYPQDSGRITRDPVFRAHSETWLATTRDAPHRKSQKIGVTRDATHTKNVYIIESLRRKSSPSLLCPSSRTPRSTTVSRAYLGHTQRVIYVLNFSFRFMSSLISQDTKLHFFNR